MYIYTFAADLFIITHHSFLLSYNSFLPSSTMASHDSRSSSSSCDTYGIENLFCLPSPPRPSKPSPFSSATSPIDIVFGHDRNNRLRPKSASSSPWTTPSSSINSDNSPPLLFSFSLSSPDDAKEKIGLGKEKVVAEEEEEEEEAKVEESTDEEDRMKKKKVFEWLPQISATIVSRDRNCSPYCGIYGIKDLFCLSPPQGPSKLPPLSSATSPMEVAVGHNNSKKLPESASSSPLTIPSSSSSPCSSDNSPPLLFSMSSPEDRKDNIALGKEKVVEEETDEEEEKKKKKTKKVAENAEKGGKAWPPSMLEDSDEESETIFFCEL